MTAYNEPDLEAWLAKLEKPDKFTVTWEFPNEALKTSYLDTIAERSEDDVRALLRRFLISSGSLGSDRGYREGLMHLLEDDPSRFAPLMQREFNRRLMGAGGHAWEGVTWALDLLPQAPVRAIEVIESYFVAHALALPDGRISGLGDAQSIIRAMWIGNPSTADGKREILLSLGAESFEHLVEALYRAMGFTTAVTARTRDGGHDVVVSRDRPGSRERTIVECKLWRKPVGVPVVRQLLGVVKHEGSTKGCLVAASGFTKPARDLATAEPQLELLGWEEILPMLDEHLGADWSRDVDWLIARSKVRSATSDAE